MRAVLFILLQIVFCIPSAFSDSLSHPVKRISRQQVPDKDIVQPDWAGFHTGVIFGAQFGRSTDKTGVFGYNADNDKWGYNEAGLNGGAEFGYSYPWHQLVLGPEIELGYLGMGGGSAQPASPNADTVGKSSGNFYTAFRGRLGVDVDHYLLFATGGAIGVDYTTQVLDSCTIAPCGGSTINAQKKNFVWGYTVGGGVERLFERGWSAKLEFLYFNLNSQSFSGITNLGNTYVWTGQTLGYIIRGGLNYHF